MAKIIFIPNKSLIFFSFFNLVKIEHHFKNISSFIIFKIVSDFFSCFTLLIKNLS